MRIVSSARAIVELSLILLVGVAPPGMAKSGGGGGSPTGCSGRGGSSFSVTSYVFDSSTGTPFQLQNDGNSKYLTYKNSRTDSVNSEIQGNTCDWVLNLSSSKSRTVQLTLAYPLTSGESLPSGWPNNGSSPVSIPALVMTNCGRNPANGSVSVGNMTGGQTIQCGLHVTFYSDGIQYSVRMNPIEWQGATWGQVTCTNADSSNLCDTWTVTPGLDANGQAATNQYTLQSTAIGELVQPSCNGCTGGTPLGLYYVDFSGMITKP